jgi:hypothetical protein
MTTNGESKVNGDDDAVTFAYEFQSLGYKLGKCFGSSLSEEEQEVMIRTGDFAPLGPYFKFIAKASYSAQRNPREGAGWSNSQVPIPSVPANPDIPRWPIRGGTIDLPAYDDDFEFKVPKALFDLVDCLPEDNRNTYVCDTPEEARKIALDMYHWVLDDPPEGVWNDTTSDASTKRFFFSGNFMPLIVKDGGGYMADMSHMGKSEYVMRPGYENLGCKIYFDSKGGITKITDQGTVYEPGKLSDPDWEYAKFKARSAAWMICNKGKHAQLHYIWANIAGFAMRLYLEPEHPVRRVFSMFFFSAAVQNRLANMVRNLVPRGSPYTIDGWNKHLDDDFAAFRFEPFPEELKRRGVDKSDILIQNIDELEVYTIIQKFVNEFFDCVYPDEAKLAADVPMKTTWEYIVERYPECPPEYTLENLKTFWAENIFRLSASHAIRKSVVKYDPFFSCMR